MIAAFAHGASGEAAHGGRERLPGGRRRRAGAPGTRSGSSPASAGGVPRWWSSSRTRARAAYLMEINGRLWGSLQLAIDAGVDFPRCSSAPRWVTGCEAVDAFQGGHTVPMAVG